MNNCKGDILFRYSSMASSEAKAHTLDILTNLRLYASHPTQFNDPFECAAQISFDAPLGIKNTLAAESLMKENPTMTRAEAESRAPQRWQAVEKTHLSHLHSWLLNNARMLSFSTVNDDILMWSHYAGRHNGICIEFRCTADKPVVDFFAKAQPVRYQEALPRINFYTTPPLEKAEALILTKAEHWSYEREWRIILPHSSEYISLPPGIISAVYLGSRISVENRSEILQSLSSIPYKDKICLFQAHNRPDAYGLAFQPVTNT